MIKTSSLQNQDFDDITDEFVRFYSSSPKLIFEASIVAKSVVEFEVNDEFLIV